LRPIGPPESLSEVEAISTTGGVRLAAGVDSYASAFDADATANAAPREIQPKRTEAEGFAEKPTQFGASSFSGFCWPGRQAFFA
jgi:hypothetical protein